MIVNTIVNELSPTEYQSWSSDLNQDEIIDILDVVLLVSFVLETNSPNNQEFMASDLNFDGEVNRELVFCDAVSCRHSTHGFRGIPSLRC